MGATLEKTQVKFLISPYPDLFNETMSIPKKDMGDYKFKYYLTNCNSEEVSMNSKKYLQVTKSGNRIQNVPMTRITAIIQ